jgi:Tol biopolymer transport system component
MSSLSKLTRATAVVAALAVTATVALPAAAQAGAATTLVSKSASGTKGNSLSSEPSVSGNGRLVAFDSYANNLVPNDTNRDADCFVKDTQTGAIELVSVSSTGEQANSRCWGPAISGDGRYVAYNSQATNLGGSTNGLTQVYLHDRRTDTTTLVSERRTGGQGGNGPSTDSGISKDGRYVVYESKANNLVNGDTNNRKDIFLYDRATEKTKRVSVRSNGVQANGGSEDAAISADGKFVVFTSYARNLVSGDTNRKRDVFVHKHTTGKTQRASLRAGGRQANGESWNGTISGNGRFVAFESNATNLVRADRSRDRDVFRYDRWKKRISQASRTSKEKQARGQSGDPTISNNGRWIAFESTAGNLAKGDTNRRYDSFVRDFRKGTTRMLTKRSDGKIAWGDQDDPFISGDGKYVVFESTAKKMVPADKDKIEDVYRRGPIN